MKKLENIRKKFRIGELSQITGVKSGTIRFYEKCGFLAPAQRLPNGYRIFDERHIYQVRICRLVFGGFVNKRLRKISMELIWAAGKWDLEAYEKAAEDYLQAVQKDIGGTKKAVAVVLGKTGALKPEDGAGRMHHFDGQTDKPEDCSVKDTCSKKQAAALVGVTPEAIRNWERNGLLGQTPPYQKRFYSPWVIERMYVIRLLLDNGYSMMAVKSFFAKFDEGDGQAAVSVLMNPGESETLIYRADRYMETLLHTEEKAKQLCGLLEEMRAVLKKNSIL